MSKFHGKIGFIQTVEKNPGVWVPQVVERDYGGNITKFSRRWDSSNQINSNVTLNMTISIIADPFIRSNVGYIRYVTYLGSKWAISDISYETPRLTLTLGGLYNGDTD